LSSFHWKKKIRIFFFFLTDGRCRVAINVLGRPTTEILCAQFFLNRRNKLRIHVGKSIWWFRDNLNLAGFLFRENDSQFSSGRIGNASGTHAQQKKRRKRTLVNTTRPSRFFSLLYLASFFFGQFYFLF
jgi:hypothetical protein